MFPCDSVFGKVVVGSPGMIGAGDTLECLNDEPKDALALLAVREDLTNFIILYSRRSTRHVTETKKFILQITRLYGRQPTNNTHKNWSLLAP